MPEQFVSKVSKMGTTLTLQGEGNPEVAAEMLRKAFPGCAVETFSAGTSEQFDEDVDRDGH